MTVTRKRKRVSRRAEDRILPVLKPLAKSARKFWVDESDMCWKSIYDALKRRGWKNVYADVPENEGPLMCCLKKGSWRGKVRPNSCMWLVIQEQVDMFLRSLPEDTGRWIIPKFPGSTKACYKANFAQNLGNRPFVPKSFRLPKQKEAALLHLMSVPSSTLFILKVSREWKGRAMKVKKNGPALKKWVRTGKMQTTVLQRYIADPLLINGLKFHCRLHVLVTRLDTDNETFQAFLHNFSYLEFATVPYKKSDRTFNGKMHLTNNWINYTKEKIKYRWPPLDKNGSEFPWHADLLADYFGVDVETFFWEQARAIATAALEAIVKHSSIKKHLSKSSDRAVSKNLVMFEFFGIDVMFDQSHKMWLLECNDSPGLCSCSTKDENGVMLASCVEYNKNINRFIEGCLNIVGLDNSKRTKTSGFWDISS